MIIDKTRLQLITSCILYPLLNPSLNTKLMIKIRRKSINEILKRSISILMFLEITTKRFTEISISNKKNQLLNTSTSLFISNIIKHSSSSKSILYFSLNSMTSIANILRISILLLIIEPRPIIKALKSKHNRI